MLDIAERCRPNQVTFVAERPDETTAAGALDLKNHQRRVQRAANALKLVRELPNARLELFDAGHAPHEEQPEAFIDTAIEFFEGRR